MATRRTTSNKRERERSKQAKATAKRERRQDKSPEEGEAVEFDENSATTEELIERIAAIHEKYDAEQISFEAFDEEKTELMELLTARLSE